MAVRPRQLGVSLFVFDGRMAINPALEGQLKQGEWLLLIWGLLYCC
jgi:hypothetical protein